MIGRPRSVANRPAKKGRSNPDRPNHRRLVAWLSRHDWGMYGVGAAAAVASFDRLRLLALECGWSPSIAWLLPVCIDLYAITATRRWLRPGIDPWVRRRVAVSGWLCVGLSVAGNTVQHILSLGYLRMANGDPSWIIVVLVAAVPPVMIGWLVHIEAVFRFSRAAAAEEVTTKDGPAPGSKRARLVALLESAPPGGGESNYQVAKRLAPGVGLNVQSATRYVRLWREAKTDVVRLDTGREAVS
jgi:Protein of unknown function (DUF2637)